MKLTSEILNQLASAVQADMSANHETSLLAKSDYPVIMGMLDAGLEAFEAATIAQMPEAVRDFAAASPGRARELLIRLVKARADENLPLTGGE